MSSVSFSSNYWFEGVSGKTITNRFGKHEISLNSFGINDLELWGEVPKEESLGTFGLQFACLSYGYLLNETQNQSFGIKLKGIYSKLYNLANSCITFFSCGLIFKAFWNEKIAAL